MTAYRLLFDHVLTRTDPEHAHERAFRALRAAGPLLARAPYPAPTPSPVEAMGLTFPSRLGLAAGFDKNAVGIDALADFVEPPLGLIGLIPIATAFLQWCPLYTLLGISTCKPEK